MARLGTFDPTIYPLGWFDRDAVAEGWFDDDLSPPVPLRLYFSTDAAPVTPAVNGTWDDRSGVSYHRLAAIKSGAGEQNGTFQGWTSGQTMLDVVSVSGPLLAQTIIGFIKGQLKAEQGSSADVVSSRLELYVVNNDGSVVRGTLLAGPARYQASGGFANPPTPRNKTIADGDALTPLAVLDGDRVVICTGFSDAGTTPLGRFVYGEDATTPDLPEDQVETGAGLGWIEFSHGLLFAIEPVGIASAEIFGAARIDLLVGPAGAIATGEAAGTPQRLDLGIGPLGAIASAEAFGSTRLNLEVTPSGIASAEAFGADRLDLALTPAGIGGAEAFGATRLDLQVVAVGIGSLEAFGAAVVRPDQSIAPAGVASAEAFGAARLDLAIAVAGIGTAEALGAAQLNTGLQVAPSGIASGEALGAARLDLSLAAAGVASAEAFGSAALQLALFLSGVGNIASLEGFGLCRVAITAVVAVKVRAPPSPTLRAVRSPPAPLGIVVASPQSPVTITVG